MTLAILSEKEILKTNFKCS